MKTRITELLNIQYPILLPGMSWISTPELVAAVSNAGGLGILASGPLSPAETKAAIQKIRELTDKPFGIGVTLLMPGAKENAEVALDEKVPVINFSLGKGDWIVDRKSTRLNSSHVRISYAVFCLKKKTTATNRRLRSSRYLLSLHSLAALLAKPRSR